MYRFSFVRSLAAESPPAPVRAGPVEGVIRAASWEPTDEPAPVGQPEAVFSDAFATPDPEPEPTPVAATNDQASAILSQLNAIAPSAPDDSEK